MSIFSTIGDFFKGVGGAIVHALGYATTHGLTDKIVQIALAYARTAATQFADNASRREYVVAALQATGIPESIARLAVELAVQALKRELAANPPKV